MKTIFLFLVSISCVFGQEIKGLDSNTFQKALKHDATAQLVDLRSEEAFNEGHIKGAIRINYEERDFETVALKALDKNQGIYLYCFTGKESQNATVFLKDLGFKEVHYLDGGFSKWTSSSKPYVSSRQSTKPIAPFTVENLNELLSLNSNVLLFLYSKTCPSCEIMETVLRRNTGGHTEIKFVKMDIERDLEISEHFNAIETPTMLYFQNGRQVWRYSGEIEEDRIQAVLFNQGR